MTTSSLAPLPRAVRRRGLIVLLATTFLMWAGFYMIVPILSVHFVDDLGWVGASIGNLVGSALYGASTTNGLPQ